MSVSPIREWIESDGTEKKTTNYNALDATVKHTLSYVLSYAVQLTQRVCNWHICRCQLQNGLNLVKQIQETTNYNATYKYMLSYVLSACRTSEVDEQKISMNAVQNPLRHLWQISTVYCGCITLNLTQQMAGIS